jgi:hypothetical protein
MAQRTWKVAQNTSGQTKKINYYFVSDAHDDDELDERPKAAMFPISQLFDDELQEARAHKYAEYLNKLNEAARVAQEQTHLVDILSRP